MPRSWTPVGIRPLAIAVSDLLPSVYNRTSALFVPEVSLRSTICLFSRLNHAACILALPGSEHTLTGMHAGFATTLLAMLWVGGTFTHWVTMTNFQKVSPFFPKVSGLTWRELYASSKNAENAHKNNLRSLFGEEYAT